MEGKSVFSGRERERPQRLRLQTGAVNCQLQDGHLQDVQMEGESEDGHLQDVQMEGESVFNGRKRERLQRLRIQTGAVNSQLQDGHLKEGLRPDWASLPEALLEKMLVRAPFPLVFKLQGLSTAWLARFSPPATIEDEGMKSLAACFQRQVGEWSATRWPTFCPLFVQLKKGFIGYNQTSQQWQRLPLFDFLPKRFFAFYSEWSRLEGSLVLVASFPERGMERRFFRRDLFVANLLTQKWRQLPNRSAEGRSVSTDEWRRDDSGEKWLIRKSAQAYKVVVFDEVKTPGHRRHFADIFDSELREWSVHNMRGSDNDGVKSNWVYLNGVFYRTLGANEPSYVPTGLLAFDVEERNFEVLQLLPDSSLGSSRKHLVVCDGDLVMLVYTKHTHFNRPRMRVMRMDLVSRRWVKVGEGPPPALKFFVSMGRPATPASSGACLFFVDTKVDRGILVFNMSDGQWSRIPILERDRQSFAYTEMRFGRFAVSDTTYVWQPSSFSPGLNPFAVV